MLTDAQMRFRDKGIGGSDAKTVMYGEAKDWITLAAEKRGEQQPKFTKQQRRLMDMGNAIEPLCLQWFAQDYKPLRPVRTELDLCREWKLAPLFRCIFDGITSDDGIPVQCKFHTGEKEIDDLADYYMPQLQHEMLVANKPTIWLAAVFGRWGAFKAVEVEADTAFQDVYQMRALAFEHFWKTGEFPKDMTPPPVATASVKVLRDHVWPAGDNTISPLALQWLNAKHYADELDGFARQLKAQFPEDARSAKWYSGEHGVLMKKNRAGVISLTAL